MYITELEFSKINVNLKDVFGDLGDKFKSKVRDIISSFASLLNGFGSVFKNLFKPLLQDVFDNLRSLIQDVTSAANELLNKSKVLAEDLLTQAFERFSTLVNKVEQSIALLLAQAGNIASELIVKVRTELLDPFIAAANEFRKNLIGDLKGLINQSIEQVVGEINKVLYKTDQIITGTLASFTNELLKIYADLEDFNPGILFDSAERREFKRHKNCKEKNNIAGAELRLLGNGKLYEYLECKDISRLYEEFERLEGNVKVGSIKTTYSDLQERAWQLACLGRNNSSLQDKALEGFIKYGQLFQLWDTFEDNMTAFLVMEQQIKELDSRIKQLDTKITTLQEKSDQIDSLVLAVQAAQTTANNAQNTANDAVSKADNAQNTANDAVSKANNAQNTANDAVSKANNAQGLASGVDSRTKQISISSTETQVRLGDGKYVAFQPDGNLVVYDNSRNARWASGT